MTIPLPFDRVSVLLPFSIVHLNHWFLWRVNEVGFDEASKNLEDYLEARELPVTYGLWVSGLTVDGPVDLGEGLFLIPGEQMPPSYETAKFCAGRDVTLNPYEVISVSSFQNIKKGLGLVRKSGSSRSLVG